METQKPTNKSNTKQGKVKKANMEFEEKQEPCTEYGADDHLNTLYEIFRDRTKTDKKAFEMFYGEVLKNVEESLK